MTISDAFKDFFLALNGVKPVGTTVSEVIRNGTASVQRNNESALATRMTTAEETITGLANAVKYESADAKSFALASSTTDSTKVFKITVVDDGTVTATEVVAAE